MVHGRRKKVDLLDVELWGVLQLVQKSAVAGNALEVLAASHNLLVLRSNVRVETLELPKQGKSQRLVTLLNVPKERNYRGATHYRAFG